MTNNDIVPFWPGDVITGIATANTNGIALTRGDEVVGSFGLGSEGIVVQTKSGGEDPALGVAIEDPSDYDPSVSYSGNDSLGTVSVLMTAPVVMHDDPNNVAITNTVQAQADGGIEDYASASPQAATPLGVNIGQPPGFDKQDKTAVAHFR